MWKEIGGPNARWPAVGGVSIVDKISVKIYSQRDGSLVLECGNGEMESDLVFASSAMHGDPLLEKQRSTLEYIVQAVENYSKT